MLSAQVLANLSGRKFRLADISKISCHMDGLTCKDYNILRNWNSVNNQNFSVNYYFFLNPKSLAVRDGFVYKKGGLFIKW